MIRQLLTNGESSWRIFMFTLAVLLTSAANAQNITVSGTVTDEVGPLPGVTVILEGTDRGVTTDFDGFYEITDVPPNAILVYSYVGFTTHKEPVDGRTEIDVALEEDTQALEEVVVVGYGTQRREAVTGSVSSIGGEDLREIPSANISEALQGRLPGVELSQTSSRPGASQQIRIRGTRSLSAQNDPLIVLNGVPFAGSLNDINPNDIQSIHLKRCLCYGNLWVKRGKWGGDHHH